MHDQMKDSATGFLKWFKKEKNNFQFSPFTGNKKEFEGEREKELMKNSKENDVNPIQAVLGGKIQCFLKPVGL